MSKSKKTYNAKFFMENTPEWKRKKDSFLLKHFYRPISFYLSAILSNIGINANTVSYISAIVAIIGSICFVFGIKWLAIVGAVIINIWLLMDCIDGNIARCVKKQPFGEFADAISSYILVALMPLCLSIYNFKNGGLLFPSGDYLILIIGSIAAQSDTLMRLVFQKYRNCEVELINNGIISKTDGKSRKEEDSSSLIVRIEMELGLAGVLPLIIMICTIFGKLDIVVIYCFIYYFGSCFLSILKYVYKAIKFSKIGE